MASINLADELTILLIFINNEHPANSHNGKDVAYGQNVNADAAWAGIRSNLAKSLIRVYKNEINGGHFENLM